ncbi:class I SAM-dependent methyltransferase [Planomonospora sp. ID82291]|uniref:class I SAM-dependent methyltransferase n=1 Tax=Planomonospora sp. ID82291 TaxID=2738136 RepID=UPI0018C40D82|nr:class I SAM-dependent methyltransferase [Planomonospora sp. ID82291]MBG0813540.1 class I SAM-dependent methyltransferase [Planomonospora sp. ID82291]
MRVNGLEAPPNVRLVGGEMLTWSDAVRDPGDAGCLGELVRRVLPSPGRVLVAGPPPEGLLPWLTGHAASVAVLLRSFPDALALGNRYPGGRGLTVYCGEPGRLDVPGGFDAVLALDGFHRLRSPEAPEASWRETFAELARFVAPGGALVLTAVNGMGIDRLAEAKPAERDRTDADWSPRGWDRSEPTGPAALVRELESEGLTAERCYAAFPASGVPRALLAVDVLESGPPVPDAVVLMAGARSRGDRHALADPADLTRKAFRYGLAARLAPAWTVVARREGAPPPAAPACPPPDALVGDDLCGRPWAVVHELVREPGGRWRYGPSAQDFPFTVGRVGRDLRARGGTVPDGRVLDEVIVEACAREDLRTVRRLLRALTALLSEQAADGTVSGGPVFATTDNLVWDGRALHLIDASWTFDGRIPLRVLLARILRRFAVRLLDAGHHHPWPCSFSPAEVTATLAAMGGLVLEDGDLDRAAALEEEIASALGAEGPEAVRGLPTYRELILARDALRDRLGEARARIDRLESRLTSREEQLHRARIRRRTATGEARAVRSLERDAPQGATGPRRVVRRLVRAIWN